MTEFSIIMSLIAIGCCVRALMIAFSINELTEPEKEKHVQPIHTRQQIVICENCLWCSSHKVFGEGVAVCLSPDRELDLVSGGLIDMHCNTARTFDRLCGKNGRWFEPMDQTVDVVVDATKALPPSKS